MQIAITAEQQLALAEALRENGGSGTALLTAQGDGELIAAFDLKTVSIAADGTTEED